MRNDESLGQGMIEMVVAIAVLVVIATGLLVAVTVAMRNADFARKKMQANNCASEAIEQVRYERQKMVWNDFYLFFVGVVGKTKGLTDDFSWEEPTEGNDGEFTREVKFEDSSGMVQVTAVCSWTDGSGQHESHVVTYFSNWQ
jgi:type II secretory pathway pseudopilin PulG